MIFKNILYLLLLSLGVLGGQKALSMEPKKYIMQTIDGYSAPITHKIIETLIANSSSLEQACKDIRALACTTKELSQMLNNGYNTRVIIKELSQKYTEGKPEKALRTFNTREAQQILLNNTYALTAPSSQALSEKTIYFSHLPNDLNNIICIYYHRGQNLEQRLNNLRSDIIAGSIKEGFNALDQLASTFDFYKTNRKCALLVAAKLLDTPKSNAWYSSMNVSNQETATVNFYVGKLMVEELEQRDNGVTLLKSVAVQYDNKEMRDNAQNYLHKLGYKQYGTAQISEVSLTSAKDSSMQTERTESCPYYCRECKGWFAKRHYENLF